MAFSEYRAQILNFFQFYFEFKKIFFGYIPIQWSLKYNFYPVLSFFQSPPSTLITNAFLCYKCIFCCDTVYASGDDCSRSLGIPQCTTPDPPSHYDLTIFSSSHFLSFVFSVLISFFFFFFPPWSWPQHHPSFACVYSWKWHPYMAAYLIVFSF